MTRTRSLAIGLAFALFLAITPGVQADVLAYDPFSYTSVGAALVASTGSGTGFSDTWHAGGFNASISNNYTIAAGSLSDANLVTAGNSITTLAQSALSGATRDLSPTIGTAGTTTYFSVLLRPDGTTTGGTFNNFYGLYLNSSVGNEVFFGKPGNGPIANYDVETRGGSQQYDSGIAAVTGKTTLLVLRADFTAGIDKFTLYVNPTPGGFEPVTGTVKADTDIGRRHRPDVLLDRGLQRRRGPGRDHLRRRHPCPRRRARTVPPAC